MPPARRLRGSLGAKNNNARTRQALMAEVLDVLELCGYGTYQLFGLTQRELLTSLPEELKRHSVRAMKCIEYETNLVRASSQFRRYRNLDHNRLVFFREIPELQATKAGIS